MYSSHEVAVVLADMHKSGKENGAFRCILATNNNIHKSPVFISGAFHAAGLSARCLDQRAAETSW